MLTESVNDSQATSRSTPKDELRRNDRRKRAEKDRRFGSGMCVRDSTKVDLYGIRL